MARISVRHLTARARSDGTRRFFWQPSATLKARGWKLVRLSDDREKAIAEAEAWNARVDAWRAGTLAADGVDPVAAPPVRHVRTLGELIDAYEAHRRFTERAPATREAYRGEHRKLRAWAGDAPIASIGPARVQKLYEAMRARTPTLAAHVVTGIGRLYRHGLRYEIIPAGTANPAEKAGITKVEREPGRLWSPQEIEHFTTCADRLGHHGVGTAILVNGWLGQRMADVLGLPRVPPEEWAFRITQGKTKARVVLDVAEVPAVRERILFEIARLRDAKVTPTHLIVTPAGERFSLFAFRRAFRAVREAAAVTRPAHIDAADWRDAAVRKAHAAAMREITFRTLRHTAVVRMGEAGSDIPEISSVTGHTLANVDKILEHYLVRTRKLAKNAFRRRVDADRAEAAAAVPEADRV